MKTQINVKDAMRRAGGVALVAAHFEINPVSVYEWIKRDRVPADKCPEIEKLSGGAVKCEEMNSEVDWQFVRTARQAKRIAPAKPPH